MAYVRRLMLQALRSPSLLISLALFLAGLYAYTSTLAPTVLEGDAALFQYTPSVLGVTYPTGYPLYILLGKLWLTLCPFGEMAWRMNLLSAICSAAALPLIYGAGRRLLTSVNSPHPFGVAEGRGREEAWWERVINQPFLPTWAAFTAVLTFATLPTFWRWSTETKIYALNILLFSSILFTLALAYSSPLTSRFTRLPSPLALPSFLLGLQITVHSTTVLLIPGLLLFAWLHFRPYLLNKKLFLVHGSLFIVPLLLYFYIPFRAEGLIAQYGRPEAIARGVLADFYHSGLSGWIRYFTAADFTGGVVTNWGQVPQQFVAVYLPLLKDEFTSLGIVLGLVGGLGLAFIRPRLFWPLFLLYALPIPFVLTYGQGEQSAFLLPSFLIFSLFIGSFIVLLTQLGSYVFRLLPHSSSLKSIIPALLFLLLIPLLFLPKIRYNVNWLTAKWDRSIYNAWADALAHPMAAESAVLAHWGDLTSFWYMQYAEGRRPDLRGLYPPTEAVVADWFANGGRDLYLAGPLQGWAAGIEDRYQLIPWGRLVRLAPLTADPLTLLPPLPHSSQAVFDNKLRLMGADFPAQAVDGYPYGVTLAWQTLADLPPETTISLRLSQGEVIAAQLDDTLLSGWFPHDNLLAGQYVLSYVPIALPLGTLPGKYRLQLVAYTSYKHPWPLADGSALVDLGEVELTLPPVSESPQLTPVNPLPGYDFNGEIALADYTYTAERVGQGKGFGIKLLWQTRTQPADNYTLLAELVNAGGQVLRSVTQPAAGGRAPTAGWQPGQYIRDQVDLVLPASAPVGEATLSVRLSWLRPNGSKLAVRRWLLPVGESLTLKGIAVTEKENRVFTAPPLQYSLEANFDNKARLLGYNTDLFSKSGLRWNPSMCQANAPTCPVHFDFYWQGISEMDSLYFVFLHWVDEQGQIVAQHDLGPGKRGKEPTTSWLPGEVILDPVDLALPPDLPSGRYTMRLGLYLPPNGPRLPLLDKAGQPAGEFVELGAVEVKR